MASNNTLPNIMSTVFTDQMVNVGRVGYGRFWEANRPRLAKPSEWVRGDIARYKLKDGSFLWVTRVDATTIRFHLSGGKVLADLNIYEGWKNDAALKKYEVPGLLTAAAADPEVQMLENNEPISPGGEAKPAK